MTTDSEILNIAQLMADMKLGREHTIAFPSTSIIPRNNLTVCNLAALNFSRTAFAIVLNSKGSIWTDVVPKLISSQTIEVRFQSAEYDLSDRDIRRMLACIGITGYLPQVARNASS